MDMSDREYREYVQKKARKSPVGKNCAWAFCVGGGICVIGQLLLTFYGEVCHLEKEDASAAVSVTLILIAAVLTGLGVFDKLAKHAGAGTLVPITGFANAVVSPALEFKTEGFVTGTAAKMFVIAGPVLAFGISASVIYGLVLCFFDLV